MKQSRQRVLKLPLSFWVRLYIGLWDHSRYQTMLGPAAFIWRDWHHPPL